MQGFVQNTTIYAIFSSLLRESQIKSAAEVDFRDQILNIYVMLQNEVSPYKISKTIS